MLRRAALLALLASTFIATPVLAKPDVFVGGGGVSTSASTDGLDGKTSLVNTAGDRDGNLGKLDSGTGYDLDAGIVFGKWFGFEYLMTATTHTASHQLETDKTRAVVATSLLGIRLQAPLSESFVLFLRGGVAGAGVSYHKYGHAGTFTSGTYSPTTSKNFTVSGTGTGYGVGAQWMLGKHISVGLGYTVINVSLDTAIIDGESFDIKHPRDETFNNGDFTILWHF